MSKFLWFVVGLLVGEFWSGWLMHVFYVCVILALFLWTGHRTPWCAP